MTATAARSGPRSGRALLSRALDAALGSILAAVAVPAAAQVSLPPVNLGDSSLLDGVAGPGFLVQGTLQFYNAPRFRDAEGDKVEVPDDLQSTAIATQFAVLSERKLLGGFYGVEVIVPLVHLDFQVADGIEGAETGLGDLIVSPFILQWSDGQLLGRPFYQRLNLNVALPTGSYEADRVVNVGQNTIRFNPYYAFTWMASDRWEVSGRFHYLWNSANDDPSTALQADSTQAGQAVHANFSASRAVSERVRLGAAGYYLTQITDDEIDGVDVTDSRERVLGLGPAVQVQLSDRSALIANVYVEAAVLDRPQGTRLSLRWQKVF